MIKKLLVFLLILNSIFLISADSNGIWHHASDVRSGIFGSDEQPITNYTFVNKVYFKDNIYVVKIVDVNNNLYYLNLSGDNKFKSISADNISVITNLGVGTLTPQARLDVNGAIKIGHSVSCSASLEGAMQYNSTSKVIEYCDGSMWNELVSIDSDPDPFTFTDLTGQALNTMIYSNNITPTGYQRARVSVSGEGSPQISCNGGAWSTSCILYAGQTLRVRLTSANNYEITRSATVTIGKITDTWSVKTRSEQWQTCGDILYYGSSEYPTANFGSSCWTVKNINYGTLITTYASFQNNGVIEKKCYNDLESNCELYGAVYNWYEVMQYSYSNGAKGICPTGWHVATTNDFVIAYTSVGGRAALKSNAIWDWKSTYLLSGWGSVFWTSDNANLWSSSDISDGECDCPCAQTINMDNNGYYWEGCATCEVTAFAVRCVKD